MADRAEHGLTEMQRAILCSALSPYADRIERVDLFGSRATGRARTNSDIDLVLYGDLDEALIDRVWSVLDESSLALHADVIAYNRIEHPPLKRHVDRVKRPLFTRADLLACHDATLMGD